MSANAFLLEFQLKNSEIKKLNKMYIENLLHNIVFCSFFAIFSLCVFFDFINTDSTSDLNQWLIKSVIFIILIVIIQISTVDMITRLIYKIVKRLLKFDKFQSQYKLIFNYTDICIRSPFVELTHKWSKIDKVILTKDSLFIYLKEQNAYIISISTKNCEFRKMQELVDFVEKNVMQVLKV